MNLPNIERLKIPYAKLDEQRRIVDLIGKLIPGLLWCDIIWRYKHK